MRIMHFLHFSVSFVECQFQFVLMFFALALDIVEFFLFLFYFEQKRICLFSAVFSYFLFSGFLKLFYVYSAFSCCL